MPELRACPSGTGSEITGVLERLAETYKQRRFSETETSESAYEVSFEDLLEQESQTPTPYRYIETRFSSHYVDEPPLSPLYPQYLARSSPPRYSYETPRRIRSCPSRLNKPDGISPFHPAQLGSLSSVQRCRAVSFARGELSLAIQPEKGDQEAWWDEFIKEQGLEEELGEQATGSEKEMEPFTSLTSPPLQSSAESSQAIRPDGREEASARSTPCPQAPDAQPAPLCPSPCPTSNMLGLELYNTHGLDMLVLAALGSPATSLRAASVDFGELGVPAQDARIRSASIPPGIKLACPSFSAVAVHSTTATQEAPAPAFDSPMPQADVCSLEIKQELVEHHRHSSPLSPLPPQTSKIAPATKRRPCRELNSILTLNERQGGRSTGEELPAKRQRKPLVELPQHRNRLKSVASPSVAAPIVPIHSNGRVIRHPWTADDNSILALLIKGQSFSMSHSAVQLVVDRFNAHPGRSVPRTHSAIEQKILRSHGRSSSKARK